MKKILITGAEGQDGKILSEILIKNRYLAYGFVKKKIFFNNTTIFSTKNKKFSEIKKKIIEINPDSIVHFGSDNPSYNKSFLKKDFVKNLSFTKKLIDYICENNSIQLIIISSSQIFKKTEKKINENSPVCATSYYSKFRIDSAKYLLRKKKIYNLKATVVILFNHDSKYRNPRFLLPRLVKAIKINDIKFINKIYLENITGDFSHAYDICNGIFLLIKTSKNPDKLILCSGKKIYINDIIFFLNKNLKKYLPSKSFLKSSKSLDNLIGTNHLARKIIGWKPNKDIFVAVKEMYKSY